MTPYNSPIWIVPKKSNSMGNKKWRMVIDYRRLNEKTLGDTYSLSNICDILDQLGGAKYFSVLDLASRFHQISMDPEDAHKMAFSTPHGHQFSPSILTNALQSSKYTRHVPVVDGPNIYRSARNGAISVHGQYRNLRKLVMRARHQTRQIND